MTAMYNVKRQHDNELNPLVPKETNLRNGKIIFTNTKSKAKKSIPLEDDLYALSLYLFSDFIFSP
jgi:hypothetical protein